MRSFKGRLIIGYILAFVLSAVVALFSISSFKKIANNDRLIEHSNLLLKELPNLKEQILICEYDLSGYALTNDISFIRDKALRDIHIIALMKKLDNLTKRDSVQHKFFNELNIQIVGKQQISSKVKLLIAQGKLNEAVELIREKRINLIVGRCMGIIEQMASTEHASFYKLSKENKNLGNSTKNLIIGNVVFLLLMVIMGCRFVIKETSKSSMLNKKLEENEKRLFNFLNKIPIGVLILEKDGTPFFLNDAGVSILNYQGSSPINIENVLETIKVKHLDGSPYPSDEMPLSKVLLGISSEVEQFIVSVNDHDIIIEEHTSPVLNLNNEVEYAISVFSDITARMHEASEIIKSEKRLFTFLDRIPLGVLIVKRDGNIFFINKHARNLLKLNAGTELENLNDLHSLLRPQTLEGEPYAFADLPLSKSLNGTFIENETFLINLNGKEIFIEINASPIYYDRNEVEFAMTVFHDVTHKKAAEEELKKSKTFTDKLLRTQEIFITNMSHEIRTPLNAILGFASLLQRTKLEGEQKNFADAIRQSGETLLTIVNDILDMSKIESGMMAFENIPFSIESLLSSLKIMLQQKAKEKSIQFKINVDPNIPRIISGDPTRLTQILLNLTHNAIKFTDQGEVSLGVECEELKEETVKIKFHIKDTGVGIPANKLEKIYERFTQANSDTTRKFGGSGLGLNIVKNLVQMQRGTIQVESIEGLGTRFTVVLTYPIINDLEQIKKTSVELGGKINPDIKILLVEDNLLNQKLAYAVLNNYGFYIKIARNGNEAIKSLRAESFDMVLMDLQMPEMDGYTTSEVIRREISTDIPIIAMTAHAMAGEREKCLSYGMNDYISKPFHEQELLSKIVYFNNNFTRKDDSANGYINLDYLKRLSVANPDFLKEMLETFILYVPDLIKDLKAYIEINDLENIKSAAHTLKSNFAFIGVKSIEEVIDRIENKAMLGITDHNFLEEFSEVERVNEKVLIEIKAELENQ